MCESVLISFQLVYTIFLLQIILPKKNYKYKYRYILQLKHCEESIVKFTLFQDTSCVTHLRQKGLEKTLNPSSSWS